MCVYVYEVKIYKIIYISNILCNNIYVITGRESTPEARGLTVQSAVRSLSEIQGLKM